MTEMAVQTCSDRSRWQSGLYILNSNFAYLRAGVAVGAVEKAEVAATAAVMVAVAAVAEETAVAVGKEEVAAARAEVVTVAGVAVVRAAEMGMAAVAEEMVVEVKEVEVMVKEVEVTVAAVEKEKVAVARVGMVTVVAVAGAGAGVVAVVAVAEGKASPTLPAPGSKVTSLIVEEAAKAVTANCLPLSTAVPLWHLQRRLQTMPSCREEQVSKPKKVCRPGTSLMPEIRSVVKNDEL